MHGTAAVHFMLQSDILKSGIYIDDFDILTAASLTGLHKNVIVSFRLSIDDIPLLYLRQFHASMHCLNIAKNFCIICNCLC